MKTIKVKINNKSIECKVIAEYNNGDIRISYPTYCNGVYNGCEEMTIKRELKK